MNDKRGRRGGAVGVREVEEVRSHIVPSSVLFFFFPLLGRLVGRLFACGGPRCCFVSSPALRSVRMGCCQVQAHTQTHTHKQTHKYTHKHTAFLNDNPKGNADGCCWKAAGSWLFLHLVSPMQLYSELRYVFILENHLMKCHKLIQSTVTCYLLPKVLHDSVTALVII